MYVYINVHVPPKEGHFSLKKSYIHVYRVLLCNVVLCCLVCCLVQCTEYIVLVHVLIHAIAQVQTRVTAYYFNFDSTMKVVSL